MFVLSRHAFPRRAVAWGAADIRYERPVALFNEERVQDTTKEKQGDEGTLFTPNERSCCIMPGYYELTESVAVSVCSLQVAQSVSPFPFILCHPPIAACCAVPGLG